MFIFSTKACDAFWLLTRLPNFNEGLVGCYVELSQVPSNLFSSKGMKLNDLLFQIRFQISNFIYFISLFKTHAWELEEGKSEIPL